MDYTAPDDAGRPRPGSCESPARFVSVLSFKITNDPVSGVLYGRKVALEHRSVLGPRSNVWNSVLSAINAVVLLSHTGTMYREGLLTPSVTPVVFPYGQ